jgi:peptide deformylase
MPRAGSSSWRWRPGPVCRDHREDSRRSSQTAASTDHADAYNVDGKLGYVINPVLAAAAGEQAGPEACLSVPGISATRRRAAHIVVTGADLRGDPVTVRGDGELARCLQHETGHLHGELYIDRLAGRERAQVMRRLREQIAAHR